MTESETYSKWQLFCMKYFCCLCCELPRHRILLHQYDVLEELDVAFRQLEEQDSESFLKTYLTQAVYNTIKYRQTFEGNTLLNVIISGVTNPDSILGVYALDPECYRTFAEIMYPIICAAHFLPHIISHPRKIRFGTIDFFSVLDLEGRYIKAIRFELSRNVKGHKFPPCMTKAELQDLQVLLSVNFNSFTGGELNGRYVRYQGLEEHAKKVLRNACLMFPEEDKWLNDGNGRKFWPAGRGIFIPSTMDFAIWVNIEDHLKLVVREPSGDFKKGYERLIQLHRKLHRRFKFYFDEHLGYLTVCPTNIGTGLHAEIELELPILQTYPDILQKILNEYCLMAYGHGGEHCHAQPGQTFFLKTTRSLGIDEYNSVMPVYEGALELLVTEERFSKQLRKIQLEHTGPELSVLRFPTEWTKLKPTPKSRARTLSLQKKKHVQLQIDRSR